jgi:integrase/recombinase XerC
MDSTRHRHSARARWLSKPPLASYVDAFSRHLTERGYAQNTIDGYLACIAHFAHWADRLRLRVGEIDETVVAQFLDEHLPRCDCKKPVCDDRRYLRAALNHLLVVLRALGVICAPAVRATPVDEELRRFDEHLDRVRGLAPKTRSMALRIVRRLLVERVVIGRSSSRRSSPSTCAASLHGRASSTARRSTPAP